MGTEQIRRHRSRNSATIPRQRALQMKRAFIPLVLAVAALTGSTEAQNPGPEGTIFLTGNQFYEQCATNVEGCSGYVAGVADTISLIQGTGGSLSETFMSCIPMPVLMVQARSI